MILLRFFAENSKNSQISESLQDEYREYKTQLKIQAFENLFRLRDSLDDRSNLDNFLLRQIEDVVENSKIKLLEKISTKTSSKELKILNKILATIDDKKIHKVEKRKSPDTQLSTPISKKTLSKFRVSNRFIYKRQKRNCASNCRIKQNIISIFHS